MKLRMVCTGKRREVWKGCAVEVINQNEPELLGHLAIAGYTKVGKKLVNGRSFVEMLVECHVISHRP